MNPTPTSPSPQPPMLKRKVTESRQPVQELRDQRMEPSSLEESDTSNLWARVWQWVVDNTFLPTWLPAPMRHPLMAFALAAALELAASMLVMLVVSIVPKFSFLGTLHILVVALIALTWGAAPSLLAAVVGAASLEFIVLPQTGYGGIEHPIDLVEAMVFLIVGTIISVIASNTERARRRAVDDYTASRARELALSETNARTDEFLSIASHELRSPLTSLKAALQLGQRRLWRMRDQEPQPTDMPKQLKGVQDLLVTAEHQVDRQDRLVSDLLDVSRIRANKLEYHLASCDLVSIVRDVVDEQRLSWPDRKIILDAPDESALVNVDAHRIGQVVTNFLTNALKYSPPDTPVRVSLTASGAEARVAVEDNGPGLTAEQQTHIWDRFHRVPGIKQQSGTGAGLGLGLHISRTIIEHHEGRVGIDSIPKKGSTFWFTVPLAQAPRASEAS